MPNVHVSVVVQSITATHRTPQHANCDTKPLTSVESSLNYIRFKQICVPALAGDTKQTNEFGSIKFSGFNILRGPPGYYDFYYVAGDIISEKATVYYESTITKIECLNNPQSYLNLKQALDPQPILRVLDAYDKPVAGVKLYAFGYSSPTFDNSLVKTYRLNGKRYALLENVESELSDGNGIVKFDNLTVIGSTDQIVYIHFAINGLAKEWSTSQSHNILFPSYPHPIIINQINGSIFFVNTLKTDLIEGETIGPVKLQFADYTSSPLQGYGAIAILTEFCDDKFPNNYVLLSPKRKAKELLYPIAADYHDNFEDPLSNATFTPRLTDQSGLITFDKLRVSSFGNVINGTCKGTIEFYVGNVKGPSLSLSVSTTVHKIKFENFFHQYEKSYAIWKVTDVKGNGIRGKMVNSIAFVDMQNCIVDDIILNITNSEESDDLGVIKVEYQAIKIKSKNDGKMMIVIDGVVGYSDVLSFSVPMICDGVFSYKIADEGWRYFGDILEFHYKVLGYDQCGSEIDLSSCGSSQNAKTNCDYGYNSISPFESRGFCMEGMEGENIIHVIAFDFILFGCYDSYIQIPVNLMNQETLILLMIHIDITDNSSFSGIQLDPSLSLTQIVYTKVNQPITAQITFLKSSPLPLNLSIYPTFLPLDIPKILLNYYILNTFTDDIAVITPISFDNLKDKFIITATYTYQQIYYVLLWQLYISYQIWCNLFAAI